MELKLLVMRGSSTDLIKHSGGTLHVQLVQVQNSSLYSCTDIFDLSSTSEFEIDSCVIPDTSPATNGLHITGDGVIVSMTGTHIHTTAGGFDMLIDPALTGASSSISVQGEILREKVSAPSGYKTNTNLFMLAGLDLGSQNDPSYIIDGELAVGDPTNPAESSFGEGDSQTNNMFCI